MGQSHIFGQLEAWLLPEYAELVQENVVVLDVATVKLQRSRQVENGQIVKYVGEGIVHYRISFHGEKVGPGNGFPKDYGLLVFFAYFSSSFFVKGCQISRTRDARK